MRCFCHDLSSGEKRIPTHNERLDIWRMSDLQRSEREREREREEGELENSDKRNKYVSICAFKTVSEIWK